AYKLTTHKCTHSGERPHACDEPRCEYRAVTAGNLTWHKRTHSGERPYAQLARVQHTRQMAGVVNFDGYDPRRPAVVIDNGTGKAAGSLDDLDFLIGDEALAASTTYNLNYPVRHGIVENWDNMERFWQRSIFKHLRCDPSEHAFLLTEPPMNTPENRELTAEIIAGDPPPI
ncbi:hypothetical protein T492DRAFT_876442, partial [Pavlovales sp. CCMP2436]